MKNEELRIKNEGGNFLERKVSFFIELNKKIYIYNDVDSKNWRII